MEKIVLVCRESGNHGKMIALIEDVFPECTVEIIPKQGKERNALKFSPDVDRKFREQMPAS